MKNIGRQILITILLGVCLSTIASSQIKVVTTLTDL